MAGSILVTGGCGFIGSNFIRYLLEADPQARVVNYDALTYAGNLQNLADLAGHPRYRFVHGDITDRQRVREVLGDGISALIHFAAESHVDRSIHDSGPFVRTNVLGTQVLLDAARELKVSRVISVSTDEVYGTLGPTGAFSEDTPLAPNSPFAASKAAADLLVRAAVHTHGLDAVITRCSNNYGPLQFPEKLIPLMIINALEDKPLPVYGDGRQVRDWLHVADHCEALDLVLDKGKSGEVYIGGDNEQFNIDIVKMILARLGKAESLIRYVTDRPGHDRRYAIDASKITRELGWKPVHTFPAALEATIAWYLSNRTWWERIRSGAYRDYYEQQYGTR